MAIGIIQGLQELIEFTDYNAALSTSQYYSSNAEVYNFMLENAWKSGNAATIRGVIDGGKVSGKIIEIQPYLEGGTKVGIDVAEVTESAVVGEEVGVTTGAASMGAIPLIEGLGAILAGLGVGIVSYEANKDFWVDVSNNVFLNFPGYEPITYDNIEEMSLLTLFKDGKTYIDAEMVQAVNDYLIEIGAFEETVIITPDVPEVPTTVQLTQSSDDINYEVLRNLVLKAVFYAQQFGHYKHWTDIGDICRFLMAGFYHTNYASLNYSNVKGFEVSVDVRENAVNLWIDCYTSNLPSELMTPHFNSYSIVDYEWADSPALGMNKLPTSSVEANAEGYTINSEGTYRYGSLIIGTMGVDNGSYCQVRVSPFNAAIVIRPNIPELPALQPRTISTTPNSIPTEMPDWWANHIEIGNIDPDTMTVVYPEFLPISLPSTSPIANPVTDPQADIQTGRVPSTNPTPILDFISSLINDLPDNPWRKPTDPTPKPTPTPVIPAIPTIGGQANALFTVYNPSQANLNSLGGVLWSQNIIEQIVQMFTNNPMDAIISLHILYATPSTGSNKEIKLGYLPTGVSCPVVTNQYTNLDCGTVRVPELFGDVRDYANTDVTIYLPMIGFRQLKTEDAMASYINVNYKVDVFTGTVLANVTVSRDSVNQVFYTFEGNCAVNLPLTGADKSRQLATAVGVIGATVMGSPLMGMASMAGVAGGGARANLTRSGNFTGNAGAMGCKKPYIIVSSDVPYDAVGYNTQYGYPANITVMLGTCHGYVKAKEVHADTIANATEQEKREIENQLKQGIIIH